MIVKLGIASGGGRRECGRDSGDDFEVHTGAGKLEGFFAAATEYEGITPLETDYALAGQGEGDQQRVDLRLGGTLRAWTFTDVDPFGVRVSKIEDAVADQTIVDDDIRRLFRQHVQQL